MKKAIVTGANGFVGSYLTDELYKRGYEIWAVVKDKSENILSIKKNLPILFTVSCLIFYL